MIREHTVSEANLRDFYQVLFRHQKKILLFFFAVVITVTLATLMFPEIFRSEAALMLRVGRESVSLDPTATTGQVVSISGVSRENEINSELQILNSRELAENVVDAIGVDMILNGSNEAPEAKDSVLRKIRYSLRHLMQVSGTALAGIILSNGEPDISDAAIQRDKAVRSLMKNMSVGAATKSNIITIAVEMESADLARNVLSKIIDIYLDMHINVHRTSGSYEFFDQQKRELKQALLESEKALKNLKNSTGISALGDQRRILLDRTGDLQRELEKTESDIASSTASIKSLQEKLAKTPITLVTVETSGFPNSATDELQKRLNELKLKEQDMLSTFTKESIPVKEIRRQIGEVTSLLQNTNEIRQVTTGLNETHQEIRLMLAKEEGSLLSLHAKAGSLKDQLGKARDKLKTMNENEVLFTKLQREMEIHESNYRKYSGSLEQSRIDQELEMGKISNISVVQKSSSAIKPVRPKKLLNLSLAILIGLFGGLAWAFTSERMDHSLKKPEDVHGKLQLPLFAVLPQLPAEKLQSIGVPYEPSQSMPGSRKITNSDLPVPIDNAGCCESFGKSLLQAPGSQPKSLGAIAVTSCHSGEGVSTIVSYIAKLLADHSDGRVLIVNADSNGRRQWETGKNLAKAQSSPPNKDQHNASNIKSSRIENVDLLTPRESGGRIDLKALAELLPALRREYNHIVVDLPSLRDNAAVTLLTKLMDRVVLVVEAERTRWEVVSGARDRLIEAGADSIGVVLNKRRFHVPEWVYRRL